MKWGGAGATVYWAECLRVVTEFHHQGFCGKALTAGGAWILMFEVKRPELAQFSQKTIILLDLRDAPAYIFNITTEK